MFIWMHVIVDNCIFLILIPEDITTGTLVMVFTDKKASGITVSDKIFRIILHSLYLVTFLVN